MSDQLLGELDRLVGKTKEAQAAYQGVDQETLARWRKDPFRWARERLKIPLYRWFYYAQNHYRQHKWDGTPEPLWTAGRHIADGFSAAILSATGTGKTFFAAVLTLWWLDCWENSRVVTMAPKEDQLSLHIWKEIAKLFPLFQKLHPKCKLMGSLELRMRPWIPKDEWGALGFACGVEADEEVATKAQGFHCPDLLFIIEETTGVHEAIINAVIFTCVSPHNLQLYLGNPNSVEDTLSRVAKRPGVKLIRASALDHPNIVTDDPLRIPGATSRQKLEEWKLEFGEENPIYQSRARGIPPAQGKDALINAEWVERAMARGTSQDQDDEVWRQDLLKVADSRGALGVDVAASEAGDKAAIAWGRGAMCLTLKTYRCPDPNQFARDHVYPYVQGGMVPRSIYVGIDVVGVGVGAVGEMRRLRQPVQELNGGKQYWPEYAKDNEVFANLRSQMYWQARSDLFHGRVGFAFKDPELVKDLTAPMWWTQNGKIVVESKEDFKDRLKRSPDKGDAFVYWNWVRQFTRTATFATQSRAVAF